MKTALSCFAFMAIVVLGGITNAQTLSGQATDLTGSPIANVTVEILNAQGASLSQRQVADGNYNNTPLPTVAEDNQGVIVVFSAPGQQTVQVTLNARATHNLSVVMPFADDNPKAKAAAAKPTCVVCYKQRRCRRCR